MKKITVYKVVSTSTLAGGLRSARIRTLAHFYAIGQTTTNERMPLFAFDTLPNARGFRSNASYEKILKCEAVLSPKQPKSYSWFFCDVEKFWKQVWSKKKITVKKDSPPPIGTLFCSSITPLEMVE